MLTRKVPGLELVDVDDGDVIVTGESSGHLPFQVEHHEFFIGGVESKAGTDACHVLGERKKSVREKLGVRVLNRWRIGKLEL